MQNIRLKVQDIGYVQTYLQMKVKSLFASNFQLVLVQSFDLQLSILRLDIDIRLSFYIAIILPWGPGWLLRCAINQIHKHITSIFTKYLITSITHILLSWMPKNILTWTHRRCSGGTYGQRVSNPSFKISLQLFNHLGHNYNIWKCHSF